MSIIGNLLSGSVSFLAIEKILGIEPSKCGLFIGENLLVNKILFTNVDNQIMQIKNTIANI